MLTNLYFKKANLNCFLLFSRMFSQNTTEASFRSLKVGLMFNEWKPTLVGLKGREIYV